MEKNSGQKLKFLRVENGNEYISKIFQDFYDSKGIRRELSVPNNPSPNGVAKRMNKTKKEKAWSFFRNA